MLPVCYNVSKITFAAKDIDVLEWNGDLLAVGVTEKDVVRDENSNFKNPLLRKLDASLGGLLAEASSEEDFSGKSGQSVVLRVSGLSFKRVGLFGLGQSASTAAAFLGLGEAIAAAAKASRAISVAVALAFSEDLSDESKPEIASAIALGTCSIIFKLCTYSKLLLKSSYQHTLVLEYSGCLVQQSHNLVLNNSTSMIVFTIEVCTFIQELHLPLFLFCTFIENFHLTTLHSRHSFLTSTY